jgi:flagellar biosynthetic protein FliS
MSEKILFVDDDPHLLASCERTLRRHFQIETAEGGEAGLAKVTSHGPYAVVVADRQMPRMDGIEFLAALRKRAPDTIRIMLTGNADLEGAIRVVNEGNIFRFLTKPCPPDMLTRALQDAQAQYRLVTAEKELLNKTLNGSIKLLTDILSLVDHQSFGRAQILRDAITVVTARLYVENAWEIHLAVMLASIGYVTIPSETLVRSRAGQPLSAVEEQMLARLPETAARLLANMPRLEGVARIVHYHHKHFDGSGFPSDAAAGESIPIGSRLLKILSDMIARINHPSPTRPISNMTTAAPLRSYKTIATQTAPPGQLVLMLYEGAIRFLERALAGFQHDDPLEFNATINNNVVRAQEILNELNNSLDLQQGGDLAATLRRLYAYMNRQLTFSNTRKSPEGIHDTIERLLVLRDAWSQMLRQQSGTPDASECLSHVALNS